MTRADRPDPELLPEGRKVGLDLPDQVGLRLGQAFVQTRPRPGAGGRVCLLTKTVAAADWPHQRRDG